MDGNDRLAAELEAHRPRLRALAHRMLGSGRQAEDALQEAWLRLSRTDTAEVEDLGGRLTAAVARVSLDSLRARGSRREEPLGPVEPSPGGPGPADHAVLADAVAAALLVVLDTLPPAERVAFVLHDMAGVSFDDIADVVGRSPAGARQLASRARRRVEGAGAAPGIDAARRCQVVGAFLAASRQGDAGSLLALLDPDATVRADAAAVRAGATAVRAGATAEARGAAAVAETVSGRARAARSALVDGVVGAVRADEGMPRELIEFTLAGAAIVRIDLVGDPDRLAAAEVVFLDDDTG
jgi:RNA polymerase sigma-70 factor (ECF subfamily)